MTTLNSKVASCLNDLIETCKDGEKGFRDAAEAVKGSDLKALFRDYSDQRRRFASELQREVAKLGTTPEKSGSATGALHRGWINLKAAITGKDEGAIVAECERGEDAAKAAYAKAL